MTSNASLPCSLSYGYHLRFFRIENVPLVIVAEVDDLPAANLGPLFLLADFVTLTH